MWMRMRRTSACRASLQRSAGTGDRHVAHAPPGLVAEAVHDHLVVGKQSAVEEQRVRGGDAPVQVVRDPGAARRKDEAARRPPRPRRPTVPSPISSVRTAPSSSQSGTFPGTGKSSTVRPGSGSNGSPSLTDARGTMSRPTTSKMRLRADHVQGRARAPDRERLPLAQREQPRRVIDVGIGQENGGDRRVASLAARLHGGGREDLLAEIDRGVEQEPALRRRR